MRHIEQRDAEKSASQQRQPAGLSDHASVPTHGEDGARNDDGKDFQSGM